MDAKFKEALASLLSCSTLIDGPIHVERANLATFQTQASNQLIVMVGSVEDLAAILQFSTKHKQSLHVISQGKNWGFGSKVPVHNTTLLLDLSPLNKILSYDREFGTVRIEPGVTFLQLSTFLRQNGNRHFLNIIGGDPHASVLGNILERGDGVGPYCERSDYASAPEVVLADGRVVQLGFGNVKHSKLADLCKQGIGPGLQELFLQSNLGVLTKISLWLCQVPKNFRLFQFKLTASDQLPDALVRLKSLYDKRILNEPVTFWNDYKQAACAIQFPWKHRQEQGFLHRSFLKTMSNNYKAWHVFGGIYVDHKKIGKLVQKELMHCFEQHSVKERLFSTLSARKIKIFRFLSTFHKKYFEQIIADWEQTPLLGTPTNKSVNSLFWRKKRPLPSKIDPELEFCGVLWNAFVIPFNGALVAKILADVDERILKHQFEPVISFTVLNNRYVRVFQQLIFDRENIEEDKRALKCHKEIFNYLEEAGCSHIRLDILSMNDKTDILMEHSIHKDIKAALDPAGVIAPGRYFV